MAAVAIIGTMQYLLYELRTERGYTLRQLQELSGVSKTQINAIENGKANPTILTLELLADALGVTVIDLLKV